MIPYQTSKIAIAGNARSGKDTLARLLIKRNSPQTSKTWAFADAIKDCVRDRIYSKHKISVWTDDDEQKKIIRPDIVAYGQDVKRHLGESIWSDLVFEQIKSASEDNHIITDLRFPIEYDRCRAEGYTIIFVEMQDDEKIVPPANKSEAENNPKLRSMADFILQWKKGDSLETARITNNQTNKH